MGGLFYAKPLDREKLKHIRGGSSVEGGEPRDDHGSYNLFGGCDPGDDTGS